MGKKKASTNKKKNKGKKNEPPQPELSSESRVHKLKADGNDACNKKEFDKAQELYTKALEILSSEEEVDEHLEITLFSNRAFCRLKAKDFRGVVEDCNKILERDSTHVKALFRRGSATEEIAVLEEELEGRLQLLLNAQADFQQCLANTSPTQSSELRPTYKKMEEVQKHILDIQRQKSGQDLPSPDSQRQTILLLLTNRQNCLMQQQNGTPLYALPDEAFYMIEWNWWCRWCKYVGLVGDEQNGHIEKLLLPGSCAPCVEEEDDSGSDVDMQDEAEIEGLSPGVIDNLPLYMHPLKSLKSKDIPTQDVFYHYWYQPYFRYGHELNKENRTNMHQESTTTLRPNLVRGCHYEILPREAYSALATWYGEFMPSNCLRASYDPKPRVYVYKIDENPHCSNGDRKLCAACGAHAAETKCSRCVLKVNYCHRECQQDHWKVHRRRCGKDPVQLAEAGRVGLNNLGNTCFMNSAIQCLSHVTPLSRTFLSGRYKLDLNESNPLGTGGKLALAYGEVLQDLWWNTRGSTSPFSLKRAIARFAPRFAGFGQHDAQEFLAYLLDGLHEDLNRIRKAPYVEMPDVSDGQDMAVAGARAWIAHCKRNDSIVLDTLYGQFKSTCVCPSCEKVSVSFDAFNHVSLEIPQSRSAPIRVEIVVVTQKQPQPLKIGLYMGRNSPIREVKEGIAQLCDVDPRRITLCHVFKSQIESIVPDNKCVADLRHNDIVMAYEIEPLNEANTFHFVIHHRLITKDPAPMLLEDSDNEEDEAFGFPLLMSFSVDATCAEVWASIWQMMRFAVSDEAKDEVRLRCFSVRTQANRRVFSSGADEKSEFLPKDLDEPISLHLGETDPSRFDFFSLDWEKGDDVESSFNKENIEKYQTHSSWADSMKKQEEAKAARAPVTLHHCLKAFTTTERLDENNKWYCSSCKEHVRALKTMELWRLPSVLVVHLKRFEFRNALRRDKLDTLVDFPFENLDMSQYCSKEEPNAVLGEGVPAQYDLFGVVNHYGRLGAGHYTARARSWDETGITGEWRCFDDSRVSEVSDEAKIVSSAAYVLFYRRRTFH